VGDSGASCDMHYVDMLPGVFQPLHSTKEREGRGVGLPWFRAWSAGTADGCGPKTRLTMAQRSSSP
jgi:light-regulated signal transduction histidine kinase (bacteriophytochrome)